MILRPENSIELGTQLAAAQSTGNAVTGWDLSHLDRVVEYQPEDLTVTVQAGMTLGALQRHLSVHRQWLPLDPPDADALPLERLLALNLSGPRRLGHGTARDWLLGLRAVQADGRIILSGGRVVKNVAGFDMMKLFIGGAGSLGVIVEASFKVAPVPESEVFLRHACRDFEELQSVNEAIASTRLTPIVADAFRANPQEQLVAVIGFAGCREAVESQAAAAKALGWSGDADLAHDARLRNSLPDRLSILASELVRTLAGINPPRFIARLGNGIAHLPAGSVVGKSKDPTVERLEKRLKSSFDPAGILPGIPA